MTEAEAREQAERIASAHDLSPANRRLLASSIANALLAASKPSNRCAASIGRLQADVSVTLKPGHDHDDANPYMVVPPKGCIIDDTGTVRKVLGTLPLTADGFVIGDDYLGPLYCIGTATVGDTDVEAVVEAEWPCDLHDCFVAREAAEAARKEAR